MNGPVRNRFDAPARVHDSKNKVQEPVLFFKPRKVTVSRPHLPRNPPQLHHNLPPRCTTKSTKTPVKQPLHHSRINSSQNKQKASQSKILVGRPSQKKTARPSVEWSSRSVENQLLLVSYSLEPLRGRRLACSTFLRILSDFGVTSTSSSSAINSMHCSSVSALNGTSRTASSEPEARMFESFFSRTALTSRSLSRLCSPTIIPS